MKLAPKKCKFRLNQVSYVGHQFTNGGLKSGEAKVAAIKNIGTQAVQELFFCELKDCGGSSIHVTVYTVMVWLM